MRIIQITDTHLPADDESFPELDPWKRMQSILDTVAQENIDTLVHTGDICLNLPQKEIYTSYRERIEVLNCPVLHVPGNHDRGDYMKEILPSAYTSFHISEKEGFQVLFLNTADGYVSKDSLERLRALIQKSDQPIIIFMHHPPLYAGSIHMDTKYPLQNIHEVWPVLRNTAVPVDVFCGHYHMERSISVKNVRVHITPASCYNIDPAYNEIKRDYQTPPAYRWIRLENGSMRQGLSFIDGAI